MANRTLCSVDACGNSAEKRGWCAKHYRRWQRWGDPLAYKKTPGKGHAQRYFREVALSYVGSDCPSWPFAKSENGYGVVRFDGRQQIVSRLVCEMVNGPPPTSKHEAAHTCGNGHKGCFNPRHLVWKTHLENEADKVVHGTVNRGERHGNSRLTEDQVRAIAALKGQRSQSKIAEQFGIHRSTVSDIHRGRRWLWLNMEK